MPVSIVTLMALPTLSGRVLPDASPSGALRSGPGRRQDSFSATRPGNVPPLTTTPMRFIRPERVRAVGRAHGTIENPLHGRCAGSGGEDASRPRRDLSRPSPNSS